MSGPRRRPDLRWIMSLLTVLTCAATLPRLWFGRGAERWMQPAGAEAIGLAETVAARAGLRPGDMHTGSAQFDGEWALVTNEMTVLGLSQVVRDQPQLKDKFLPAMRAAAAATVTEEALAFGAAQWGEPSSSGGEHGHAYLGYAALALGVLRGLDEHMDPALVAQHEQLIAALAGRLEDAPYGMIETYPGSTFPADVASVVGAIGQHARVSGADHSELLGRWSKLVRERYRGADGLVYQTVDPLRGVGLGEARASGTALIVYFSSFADRELALELDASLSRRLRSFWGFGGVREYPVGARGGAGDIDSGPVLFGVSVSGTGFGLAGARMSGDTGRFTALYRTATLFGAPVRRGHGWGYVVGSGLGDAILLAMMTAL